MKKKRIQDQIGKAKEIHEDANLKGTEGNFAYELSAISFSSHIDELHQISISENESPVFEVIDFRMKAPTLKSGPIPLNFIANLTEAIRTMIGYAALRVIKGGIDRKRVPKDVYMDLDLRLAAILPGSSRLIVTGNSDRDLFDDGTLKGVLSRMFSVLDTFGEGPEFIDAINELGASSARKLKEFLRIIINNSAEAEITWKYAGEKIKAWSGTQEGINKVISALDVTEIIEQEKIKLTGKVELLSKRERIDLRVTDNELIRILYPKILLPKVATLHLEQEVSLLCQVTEADNPLTNESSIFYELLDILD